MVQMEKERKKERKREEMSCLVESASKLFFLFLLYLSDHIRSSVQRAALCSLNVKHFRIGLFSSIASFAHNIGQIYSSCQINQKKKNSLRSDVDENRSSSRFFEFIVFNN